MSHGFELAKVEPERLDAAAFPVAAAFDHALKLVNKVVYVVSSLAIVAASLILTSSVIVRYVFHAPTDWQDEASVFLLVGAIFMSAAGVQAVRGHVAIDLFANRLGLVGERIRRVIIDVASLAFCAFFAWKSWMLCHEAWVDDQVTSSTWGPPLWIPYAVMSIGMTLLCLQITLQVFTAKAHGGKRS
ncbi:TRAP transporter small permease [Oleomonas cavernae]|uniref:TRAP transporter small permease protein n=1 Tax=Oleomonas cavernae TaxID=2320859 RepID=A0A418VZB8_9PROT|nr:TRAP transporter small permease [Oleomonas cavernae]RJF82766.1 TRAP transporter small permease [Oleomonas cavernae]RJF82768.1 TRAP transporter small permease [Oleomonas cavernae]RJF88697.1 TRAP transporter small permease [Oleomonas cavernae]